MEQMSLRFLQAGDSVREKIPPYRSGIVVCLGTEGTIWVQISKEQEDGLDNNEQTN